MTRTNGARRRWLQACAASLLPAHAGAHGDAHPPPRYAQVVPGKVLRFPRDHGAHDDYRLEWWYLTGWLRRPGRGEREPAAGVQITFFRAATGHDRANPSRFAARQLLFAHAALALPERAGLLHRQRAARAGPGWAHASRSDTDLAIGTWSLQRSGSARNESYRARIDDPALGLDLSFDADATPILQGDHGFSRKGTLPLQASYYYSRPQLRMHGRLLVDGVHENVDGIAWLDHEWSSELLDPRASGWDWTGLNLVDGSSWTAFRIRGRDDSTLWNYGRITTSASSGAAPIAAFALPAAGAAAGTCAQTVSGRIAGVPTAGRQTPGVHFEPLRHWTSPRTGTRWPVSMRLTCGARTVTLEPLFDDQELDARAGTGVLYWEGAVRARENGRTIGRGYLELTGYDTPLRL